MIKEKIKSKGELIAEIEEIIKTPVPAEIKNHQSYLEHLKLNNNKIHSKIIQIGGIDVALSSPYPLLKKKLTAAGHQEDDPEWVKVMSIKKVQMSIKMRANSALRKAYGTIVNAQGEKVELKSIFDPYRQEMIELFGRMFSSKEVHEWCLTKLKLKVKLQSVQDFRRQNQIEVNKLIEEHQRTYSDIRLGHKRSRLEELVWLYHDRKRIYETFKKGEDYRLLLTTIAQIKSEAEGDVIRIDGTVNLNINETVEHHIQQNLMKTISIKEIILGRIAAKTNISPMRLVSSINSGYYRKIIDNTEDIEHEEIPKYPSTSNYDFDIIKRVQIQREQRSEANKAVDAVVDEVAVEMGNSLKKLLQAKLARKQGDVNFAKNSLSGEFIDKANG